jgi:hypothetical protein
MDIKAPTPIIGFRKRFRVENFIFLATKLAPKFECLKQKGGVICRFKNSIKNHTQLQFNWKRFCYFSLY